VADALTPERYVRFAHGGRAAYGRLDGERIHELHGPPWLTGRETGRTLSGADVRLLAPCEPSKVICVGLNYRSHLGGRPVPEYPGLFAKFPSCVVGPDAEIVLPPDARDVHYEGELVVVIGRASKRVPREQALQHVFGVTAGNDVSERTWQRADLQWVRAKATDTFAPLGPVVATGLDYGDLLLQTRVRGAIRQSERTRDLIFDIPTLVSYITSYVTLLPGDVVFTGTPGTTSAIEPGDVVEIEVEGVGVLRNTVSRER
jgi:2-keto-4-pentenoate hydratase/2-oxohepta-3-ene-1,7-dioic acid hydratase in catechol pathway